MAEKINIRSLSEMPLMSRSLGDMSFNKTGSWRYLRPAYEPKLAPCQAACPLGTNIPLVLRLIGEGKFAAAFSIIRQTNPLPGVLSRVCYHNCESACNRMHYDESVSIRALERYASEACSDHSFLESGPGVCRLEKVSLVGSGPAGLACAYYLAKQGFRVRVFESDRDPGGMLRQGIPEYRLPRAVLERDISNIRDLGVEFILNCEIGRDLSLEALIDDSDAVFVATGAHGNRRLDVEGEELPGVWSGLEFLRKVNGRGTGDLGREVLVIGGGNTAMDSARVALRLGARVTVIYRRSRNEMPAIPEEVREAQDEGVRLVFQATPRSIKKAGDRLSVRFVRMRLGAPDRSGRARPVPIPGSEFELPADNVIKAIGELPHFDFGYRQGEGNFQPEHSTVVQNDKLFAGGDAWTGPSTVTAAVAAGRKAARQIAAYLDSEIPSPVEDLPREPVEFERINTAYFGHARRNRSREKPVTGRAGNFNEVVHDFTFHQAIEEARRCFSCGTCNNCDACWMFCPDGAIEQHNGDYRIDLDSCKGCGICAHECPRGVVSLVQEVQ